MDWIDIVIKATGQLGAWLYDTVDILLRATPAWGLPPIMVMSGFFLVLLLGWQLLTEK